MDYSMILAYLPALQDHAADFAYYGEPKDDTYTEYAAENEAGEPLVMSAECEEFCETCAYLLKDIVNWEEVYQENHVGLDDVLKADPSKMDEKLVQASLMELVDSLSENDRFLDALQTGLITGLVKRLEAF